MAKFLLKILKFVKTKVLHFILILFCLIGSAYQIIQATQLYFSFFAKIDVLYDSTSQHRIPMITFCKPRNHLYKYSGEDQSKLSSSLTPSSIYNSTYDISETIFICKLTQFADGLDINSGICEDDFNAKIEKNVNYMSVCYNYLQPRISRNESLRKPMINEFWLYHHHHPSHFKLYLSSDYNIPNGQSYDSLYLKAGQSYLVNYKRTAAYLLPPPYRTNCINYARLGCKSRNDCIDKCKIAISLKNCNSLPLQTNFNVQNDKYQYKLSSCNDNLDFSFCLHKYKLPDCTKEYYSFKSINSFNLNGDFNSEKFSSLNLNKRGMKNDVNLFTKVQIVPDDEPSTIYIYSPHQYLGEFIFLVGQIIILWLGFYVILRYVYVKLFIDQRKKQSKQETDSLSNKIFNPSVVPIDKIEINHLKMQKQNSL